MSEFNNDFFSDGSGQNYSSGGYNGYNPYAGGSVGNGNNEHNDPGRKKKNKKKGNGRKWGGIIAAALVFGLVAGTTTYGVNRAANAIGGNPSASVSASSSSEEASADSSTSVSSSSDRTSGNNSSAVTGDLASTGAADSESSSSSDTSSGSDSGTSVEKVAADAMPAMVTISTMSVQEMQSFFGGSQEYKVEGAGTGVILEINDDEVLIATNNHVVTGAQTVSVGFIDESVASAEIKGTDTNTDLAVVAVKTSDLSDSTKSQIKAITIGDSDDLKLGQQVVAIGNALGYGQSVTSGYVSALNRELELSDGTNTYNSTGLIQTDAAINSGNSGGALLNMNGELVGINEAKSSSTSDGATVDNMGFAIPINKAQPILQNLMTQTTRTKVAEDERGYLGVNITDVTSDLSQIYDVPQGVVLTNVPDGSAAAEAGLKKGDIITALDGQNVSTSTALTEQLEYYAAGDQVTVTYQTRDDSGNYSEATATVTLESQSDAQSQVQQSQNTQSYGGDSGSSSDSSYQQSGGSLYDFFQRMMP